MARRQDYMQDFNGGDFNFEGDGLDAMPPPINNDPDMSTPNFFDGSNVVQPVWNPGGDASVPPTAQPVEPTDIAPNIFGGGENFLPGDQWEPTLDTHGNVGGGGADGWGTQTVTTQPVTTSATAPGGYTPLPPIGPFPTNPNGTQAGGSPNGTPWVPDGHGSWMPPPASWPAGYEWDYRYAAYVPKAATNTNTNTTGGGIPATGRTSDRAAILAQIAQWAAMPGADPSLGNDPNYWADRILEKGGLGQDNLQYWQDAGVGPTAFFRNPNRESGGNSTAGGANPGASATSGNFASLLGQLQTLLGPNSTPSNLTPPNGAGLPLDPVLNQVGQTPLDKEMDASLSDLLTHGGASPFGRTIEATLSDLISRGGLTPNINAQLIQARDANAGAMQAQTADARNELAARGLASLHGAPQGSEASAVGRIAQNLAPTYASAVTDINNHAIDVANSSVMSALTMATGMSEADATTLLNTVGTGTARQTALANIALKTLEDNMQWNEFLANFGLQRDQIAEQLQQGRIAQLTPLLNLFLLMSGQSAQGFIGTNS